jgi:hypothetical protein
MKTCILLIVSMVAAGCAASQGTIAGRDTAACPHNYTLSCSAHVDTNRKRLADCACVRTSEVNDLLRGAMPGQIGVLRSGIRH